MTDRRDSMLHLDWPPAWTAGAVALAWGLGLLLPWPVLGGLGRALGAVLVLAGFGLMGLAAAQMMLARTTVIPRQMPSALVTGGIFRFSRNPIYLGDALIVAGALLWFQVPWALPLVLVFARIIESRFILDEESRLRSSFGAEFEAWAARTGRWASRVPIGRPRRH